MLEDERTPNARLTSRRRWRNWKEFPINRNAVSNRRAIGACEVEREETMALYGEPSGQTEI